MSHVERTTTLPQPNAALEKSPHTAQDRFERRASDFRHALMRAQITDVDRQRPGYATHILQTATGIATMESTFYMPGDIQDVSQQKKLLALAKEIGIDPGSTQPTHETRSRFLRTIANPSWATYPSVQYRPTDQVPVALTMTHVNSPGDGDLRLIMAIGHNSSIVMHAETTMLDEPHSIYFPLYDGRQRQFNPERAPHATATILLEWYDAQAELFLKTHNPSSPPQRKM